MKRRRTKRSFEVKDYLIAALLSVLLLWLLFLVVGILRKEEIARQAVKETERELAVLVERKETLAADITALSTERGREATLRETFGVARPGEEVIIVVPPKEAEAPPPLPWWRKVMGWFGL